MTQPSNRIYSPILLALTLLVGIFLVRPLYTEYMDTKTEKLTVENLKTESQKELDSLIALQASFAASGSTELTEKARKLDKKWNEAEIMSAVMLNDYTKGSTYIPAPIAISSISLNEGKKLPSGLSLGTINLSLTAWDIDKVIDYLTYLTTNSEYVFTLDTINLPISSPTQKETNNIGLTINLGVYYYE